MIGGFREAETSRNGDAARSRNGDAASIDDGLCVLVSPRLMPRTTRVAPGGLVYHVLDSLSLAKTGNVQRPTYKAFAELGKAVKKILSPSTPARLSGTKRPTGSSVFQPSTNYLSKKENN